MSFRKNRKPRNVQDTSMKMEKIEEIIDIKEPIAIIDEEEEIIKEKNIEMENIIINNLKKLNSVLLLKINDYEKKNKKLENKNKNLIIENTDLKNDIIDNEAHKSDEIRLIKNDHKEQTLEDIRQKKKDIGMIYKKHNKKIIQLKEQYDVYNNKYKREIEDIHTQNKEYVEIIKKEENEKYLGKIKKKEETLQKMFNLKTKEEIMKIIQERKIRHDEIQKTIEITENVQESLSNQIQKFKEIVLNNKFNDERFKVVCLCNNNDTNKILIENELSTIFSNVIYVPYFEFHSEYITKIITILKTLENFLDDENDHKYLIIFEYDFQWLFDTQTILQKLNSIKNNDFNLLLLNYDNFFVKYKNEKNINNMIGIQNNPNIISSFIINKIYTKKLIKILEETIKNIVHNNNDNKKLYEKSFNKILKDKNCFGIVPSLGKHRLIYNPEQNINCIIAIIDNNTEILYNEIPYMYKIIKKSTYNFYHDDQIFLNEEEDISSEIIKYCYNEYKKIDYLFVFKNGYNYKKRAMKLIFKKIVEEDCNLILDKNTENFFIKLKKENLDLNNLINNKDFKIIDLNL
jgi:hypothetical protein